MSGEKENTPGPDGGSSASITPAATPAVVPAATLAVVPAATPAVVPAATPAVIPVATDTSSAKAAYDAVKDPVKVKPLGDYGSMGGRSDNSISRSARQSQSDASESFRARRKSEIGNPQPPGSPLQTNTWPLSATLGHFLRRLPVPSLYYPLSYSIQLACACVSS
eukprot:815556-Prorocentrum_minimum.AAC.1